MTASQSELPPPTTITVVTPSFNQAMFLERALRSVLDQAYPSLEYLVLDGGSTDGSVDIIERHAAGLAFWRSGKDKGQAAAVNEGWAGAHGDILGWLNSDDYLLPGSLAFVAAFFEAHPDAGMVYGPSVNVDAVGTPLGQTGGPFNWRRMILGRNMVPQPSAFIRRSVFASVGPLDESLTYGLDADFFLRIARLAPPRYVERPLSGTTIHGEAKTTRDRAASRQEIYRVGRRYGTLAERILLVGMSIAGRVYHALPNRLRDRLDRARGITSLPA